MVKKNDSAVFCPDVIRQPELQAESCLNYVMDDVDQKVVSEFCLNYKDCEQDWWSACYFWVHTFDPPNGKQRRKYDTFWDSAKTTLQKINTKSIKNLKQRKLYLVSPLALLTLSACNGSVDSSSTSQVFSGAVVKGPLSKAFVFLDFNNDGVWGGRR